MVEAMRYTKMWSKPKNPVKPGQLQPRKGTEVGSRWSDLTEEEGFGQNKNGTSSQKRTREEEQLGMEVEARNFNGLSPGGAEEGAVLAGEAEDNHEQAVARHGAQELA